jgi:hypothetical protein
MRNALPLLRFSKMVIPKSITIKKLMHNKGENCGSNSREDDVSGDAQPSIEIHQCV